VVFAILIGGKHQDQQPGVGSVLTKVFGKVYSGTKVFDPADYRFPVIEPSGAFIMTRKVALKQSKGMCVDWDQPKRAPCAEGEKQTGDFCEIATWCPSLGHQNALNPPKEAKVDVLKGLDHVLLKIMAGITFPGLSDRFFVAGGSPGGSNQFMNITVGKLLQLTVPTQKLDQEMLDHGALIGVSFFWNCPVEDDHCEPQVLIKRLDSGQGFVQKRATHSRQNGVETREAVYLNGIRFLVDSSGMGRKYSLILAMIQLGSAIALIRVAAIVADNIMLYSVQYTHMRREAYYKCKVHETQDYSDLQDRINLVRDSRGRETNDPTSKVKRGGTHTPFGMGPFGRGGMASAIVKGRDGL